MISINKKLGLGSTNPFGYGWSDEFIIDASFSLWQLIQDIRRSRLSKYPNPLGRHLSQLEEVEGFVVWATCIERIRRKIVIKHTNIFAVPVNVKSDEFVLTLKSSTELSILHEWKFSFPKRMTLNTRFGSLSLFRFDWNICITNMIRFSNYLAVKVVVW